MTQTEGVDIAERDKAIQKGPLFRQKAGILDVLFRPGEINFPVGDIEVPADYDGLAFAAFFRIGREGVEKPIL